MNKLLRPFRKHQPDVEALSAHIDGRLDAARASEIDAHLETCLACREAHGGLLETRAMLAAMPAVEHPRSFRLRQADVDAPARARPARSGGRQLMRWAPAVAGVSVVVLAVVLGADFSTRQDDSAQLTSLESNERSGITAADDSAEGAGAMAPVASTAARESTTASGGGSDAATDGVTPGESQGDVPGPVDAAEPTGGPPDGDAPFVIESGAQADADATAAANAGGSNFVPPTPTPAALGVAPPDAAPPATDADADADVDADVEQFSQDDADDGNRNAFLFVEIAAASIALLAGAAYVAWRWMQRGRTA